MVDTSPSLFFHDGLVVFSVDSLLAEFFHLHDCDFDVCVMLFVCFEFACYMASVLVFACVCEESFYLA